MDITASQLRADIYRLLDRALETGEPIRVVRNGRTLKIIPEEKPSRLSRLVARPDAIRGDPAELVHIEWTGEWHPDPTP